MPDHIDMLRSTYQTQVLRYLVRIGYTRIQVLLGLFAGEPIEIFTDYIDEMIKAGWIHDDGSHVRTLKVTEAGKEYARKIGIPLTKPHAYDAKEAPEVFLRHLAMVKKYWMDLPNITLQQRMSGVIFSILSTVDGCNGAMPGFNIVPVVSDHNARFHAKCGEHWFQDGKPINEQVQLHELWHQVEEEFDDAATKELEPPSPNPSKDHVVSFIRSIEGSIAS